MSFLSIFKKIGSIALKVEHVASPIISTMLPGAAPIIMELDTIFQHLQSAVITVESNNPLDAQGAVKSASVVSDFNSGLELTQSILAMKGEMLSYDATALQTAISAQVTALNAMAAVKASFKIVSLATPSQTPAAPAVTLGKVPIAGQ